MKSKQFIPNTSIPQNKQSRRMSKQEQFAHLTAQFISPKKAKKTILRSNTDTIISNDDNEYNNNTGNSTPINDKIGGSADDIISGRTINSQAQQTKLKSSNPCLRLPQPRSPCVPLAACVGQPILQNRAAHSGK